MSKAIENLEAAQKHAMAIRPMVGGFPYLAETLRRAGVIRNLLVLTRLSESVFDQRWPSGQPGHAVSRWHN